MTFNPRPGAVIATRLSILAAESADHDRFGRGRRYFKESAVVDCTVEHAVVSGRVQGSEAVPYSVALRWRPEHLPGPVPVREELAVSCSCSDSAPVCKHAVALLLRLADDVGRDPTVLERWRGPDSSWSHLPARPTLSVVRSDDGPAPARRGVEPRRPAVVQPSEPDPLEPFFGVRSTLWGTWAPDEFDPFPGILPLSPGARPPTSDPLAAAAAGLLDETLDLLASLFA